jgi:type II secretory pathway pseudopilin PulG
MRPFANLLARAFTLLEVMIAVAFIGIALLGLLSLHHTDLQSVIRSQNLTAASMLAQTLMTQAELERFPAPGSSQGDFSRAYPGMYPNFRWQRTVEPSPLFPDIRRVEIRVLYGPGFRRSFGLTEFMHNPVPPPQARSSLGQPSEDQPGQDANGGASDDGSGQ